MYDIHIEEFYRDCARVMLQLYQSFPRKSSVFVEDISGPDMPDEYGIHSDRFQSCFGAMLWLESEGYLVYEALVRQEAIDQACLTSQGLRLMNQVSDLSDLALTDTSFHQVPNVDVIRHVMKKGTSTQLARLIIHLFSEHRAA